MIPQGHWIYLGLSKSWTRARLLAPGEPMVSRACPPTSHVDVSRRCLRWSVSTRPGYLKNRKYIIIYAEETGSCKSRIWFENAITPFQTRPSNLTRSLSCDSSVLWKYAESYHQSSCVYVSKQCKFNIWRSCLHFEELVSIRIYLLPVVEAFVSKVRIVVDSSSRK